MPDRADYLARLFVTRLRGMDEATRHSEERGIPERLRHDLATKVLAVEAGVTDEATVRRVAEALPRIYSNVPSAERKGRRPAAPDQVPEAQPDVRGRERSAVSFFTRAGF